MLELGIWLQKRRRNKGLAVVAATAFLAFAPGAGAQTAWVCGLDSSGLSGSYWAWAHAPAAVTAANDKAEAQYAALTLGRRTKLQLVKQDDIAALHKHSGASDGYAGFATLHLGKTGMYRIAANEAADIDIVGGKALTKPQVKHGPVCSTIAQIAEMKLHAGDVVIQLANAQHPTLDVLVLGVDSDDAGF